MSAIAAADVMGAASCLCQQFVGGIMVMYEPHPLSMLLPRMTEDEYRALCDDIHAKGLIDPIRLFQEKVLDGNNRQRACEETGVTPRYEPFDGDVIAARALVLSVNLKRRHLSTGQRALIAGRLATISHGGDRKSDQGRKSALEAMTIEEAANEANVTKDTAKKGRAIVQSGFQSDRNGRCREDVSQRRS
jgi:hypothetical protein